MKKLGRFSCALFTCICLAAVGGLTACKSKPKAGKTSSESTQSSAQTPEATQKPQESQPHQHAYNGFYSHDDEYHWIGATCCEGVKKDNTRHEYDGDTDATCNVCGYERTLTPPATDDPTEQDPPQDQTPTNPETPELPTDDNPQGDNTNPPASGDDTQGDDVTNPPADEDKPQDDNSEQQQPTPTGFGIEAGANGLVIEGVESQYQLSKEVKALDFGSLNIAIYSATDGVKGTLVPAENYQLTLYYGSTKQENPQNLACDGTYTLKAELIDCYRIGGSEIPDGEICGELNFTVKNPVVKLNMVAGKTVQTQSEADKISATWQFECERANGEVAPVPSSQITLSPLNTSEAGVHTAVAKYGDVQTEISYEIEKLTVINSVSVALNAGIVTEISGEYLTLDGNDFEVSISADGSYTADKALRYGGVDVTTLNLAPQPTAHEVTVVVSITYTVDGEPVKKTYENIVEILVTEKPAPTPPEPTPPEPEQPALNYQGVKLHDLLTESDGAVRVQAEGSQVTACETGLKIERAESGEPFTGIKFSLDGAAEIVITARSENAMIVVCDESDEIICEGNPIDQSGTTQTFPMTEGGNYYLTILFLSDELPTVYVDGIEIIYPQA